MTPGEMMALPERDMNALSPNLSTFAIWSALGSCQKRHVESMLLDGGKMAITASVVNIDLNARIELAIAMKKRPKKAARQ
tara:strand:+ start:2860 stop:3099 length:240 start_codon:yes stop_codon:yes gene_type:complete